MTDEKKRLHIANMVCPRCVRAVEKCLAAIGHSDAEVTLGEARLVRGLTAGAERDAFVTSLQVEGFELLEHYGDTLVAEVKTGVIAYVRELPASGAAALSSVLSGKLFLSYGHLARQFKERTGKTIERYTLEIKVERAKELLEQGDLLVNEVGMQLGYRSPSHFTAQFRRLTGVTPTRYLGAEVGRRGLEEL